MEQRARELNHYRATGEGDLVDMYVTPEFGPVARLSWERWNRWHDAFRRWMRDSSA